MTIGWLGVGRVVVRKELLARRPTDSGLLATKGKGWQRACPGQNGNGDGIEAGGPSQHASLMEGAHNEEGGNDVAWGRRKRVSHRHLDTRDKERERER